METKDAIRAAALLDNLAHNLASSLNTIRGWVELLETEGEDEGLRQNGVEAIRQAADGIEDMLGTIYAALTGDEQ